MAHPVPRVLVAGSANLDFVVRVRHIPHAGETVLGSDFKTFPGGKGANQAVACARAGGVATSMLLALGDDAFAAPIEHSLRGAGVALNVVRTGAQPTGVAFVNLAEDGENAITVAAGANELLRPEHLPSLEGFSHLLLQLETPIASVEAWAQAAHAAGLEVVLNAAPAHPIRSSLLAHLDMLIVNEHELATLAGIQGTIAQQIETLPVASVVVTLGARGCCARMHGEWLLQPGFQVTAVDTTGAGDTFCGALVAASARGLSPGDALRRACAASALACTRFGAQPGVPNATEVDALLASTSAAATSTCDDLAGYCGLTGSTISPSTQA